MNQKKKWTLIIALDLTAFLLISLYICAMSFNFFGKDAPPDIVTLQTPEPVSVVPTPDTENPEATPEHAQPVPTPYSRPDDLLGDRFAEKFLQEGEEIIDTETLYRSQNVCVELRYVEAGKAHYQVADIYIKNIESLRCHAVLLSKDNAHTPEFYHQMSAIAAINGDYYLHAKGNKHGWFVRDGAELARFNTLAEDLCVIYYDGRMETFDARQGIDVNAIYAKLPWQIFYFGPALLDADGRAKTSFNSKLGSANPRTAIGCYEPGRYAFIVVQGTRTVYDENGKRLYAANKTPSVGMTLAQLSALCEELGLTAAYNLDGGGSSTMMFFGRAFGHNSRDTSDIIYIKELS
ncbi:MAG: phosphodiester glycosidase family protein [Clostridiales bacterium]|nr:phosphodiester glycosidase family protein [Clostridiales bacterium]